MENQEPLHENEDWIEELSDDIFDESSSIARAREIYEVFVKNNLLIKGEFSDSVWEIEKDETENRATFHFNTYLFNAKLTDILKCWVLESLQLYSVKTVQNRLYSLNNAILRTNGFSDEKVSEFEEYICTQRNSGSVHPVFKEVSVSLQFLDFYTEFDQNGLYKNMLSSYLKQLKPEKSVRELPPAKDIVAFQQIVDEFFTTCSQQEKTYYYPILIWWKLSNVIPMRPNEYCEKLSKDCVFEKNNRFYIKLPRSKQKKTKTKLEVVDTLEINKDIFDLINEYNSLVEGDSNRYSLFSYKTMVALRGDFDPSGFSGFLNHNSTRFNTTNFYNLLKRFYKEIVREKYELYHIQDIRPNDTRHFAFCSLMLQGVDPLTIARLGGHTRIDSQYSYQQHTEFFVDCEVYKLSQTYLKEKENGFTPTNNWSPNGLKELKIEGLRDVSVIQKETGFLEKMELGYCTDQNMDCESENCWECSKWWISQNELQENEEQFITLLSTKERGIKEKIALLQQLRKDMSITFADEHDPGELAKMKQQTIELQTYLEDLARLKSHINH